VCHIVIRIVCSKTSVSRVLMCDVLHCWNIVCVILRYVSYALKVVCLKYVCVMSYVVGL